MPLPTFFELMTIGAFIYFNKKNVDIAVLEVGMGGTLDATNIVTPLVSVITSISYDHCEVLGNTLEEILDNKLGIVKEKVPFVTFCKEFKDKYVGKSLQCNSPLIEVLEKDIKDVYIDESFKTNFIYKNESYKTSLVGIHQSENMALAIETINVLNKYYNYNISLDCIKRSLNKLFIPARMQVLNEKPLVIVDGAHNSDGIKRLVEAVKNIKNGREVIIITAIAKNKRREEMLSELLSICDKLIVSEYDYIRSSKYEDLINLSKKLNKDNLEIIYSDIDNIINNNIINNKDAIYLFCGSLYFAGEVISKYKK